MTKAKQEIVDEVELSADEHNELIFAEIKKREDEIKLLRSELKPAEPAKQVSLNDCNIMARKANIEPVKVDPKLI